MADHQSHHRVLLPPQGNRYGRPYPPLLQSQPKIQWLAKDIDRGRVIYSTHPIMFTKPTCNRPKRPEKVLSTLKALRRAKSTITVSDLQNIHGKLQFTSIALPCGKALLGPIDTILVKADIGNHKRIKMNKTLKNLLADWAALTSQTQTSRGRIQVGPQGSMIRRHPSS